MVAAQEGKLRAGTEPGPWRPRPGVSRPGRLPEGEAQRGAQHGEPLPAPGGERLRGSPGFLSPGQPWWKRCISGCDSSKL